jgi:flagellar motor switch protein FliM
MSDPQQGRQDALEELLRQDDAGGEQTAVEQAAALVQGLSGSSSFDFSRPTKISRQFEKNLITFAEAFAKSSSLGLTGMLRANTGIGYRGLEVMNFGEFVGAMPPVTCAVNIGLAPLNGLSLLHFDAGMIYLMMMRLLGGPLEACRIERKFTDIELGIARLVIDKLMTHIAEGAEKFVAMQPTFVHLENNPTYLTTVTSGEPVLLIRFEIAIEELRGPLDLCIPLTAFEPVWHRFDPEENSEFRTPEEVRRDR